MYFWTGLRRDGQARHLQKGRAARLGRRALLSQLKVGEEGAGGAGEGASVKDDGGDGALGLGIGDADEAARSIFVDGHLGDE